MSAALKVISSPASIDFDDVRWPDSVTETPGRWRASHAPMPKVLTSSAMARKPARQSWPSGLQSHAGSGSVVEIEVSLNLSTRSSPPSIGKRKPRNEAPNDLDLEERRKRKDGVERHRAARHRLKRT